MVYEDEYYSYTYPASCTYSWVTCAQIQGSNQGLSFFDQSPAGSAGGGSAEKNCAGQIDVETRKYFIRNNINGKRIDSIITSSNNTLVLFNKGEAREDLDASNINQLNTSSSLESIEIYENSACSKWIFNYTYSQPFPSYSFGERSESKRLVLTEVQQKSCPTGQQVSIPPYKFYYKGEINNNYVFPDRFSWAIDHWGFYNGAIENEYTDPNNINIPQTTKTFDIEVDEIITRDNSFLEINQGTLREIEFTHGDNDRETNPDWVDLGILEKVIYPTGGVHEFAYETNTYIDTGEYVISEELAIIRSCGASGSDCCANYAECCNAISSFETSFDSIAAIDSSRLLMEFRVPPGVLGEYSGFSDPSDPNFPEYNRCYEDYNFDPNATFSNSCAGFGTYNMQVKAYKVSDNSLVGGLGFNNELELDLNENNKFCHIVTYLLRDLEIYQTFEINTLYRFELEVDQGLGKTTFFSRYSYKNYPLTKYAGGVRIKEVKTKLSESSHSYETIKNYSYNDPNTGETRWELLGNAGKLFLQTC